MASRRRGRGRVTSVKRCSASSSAVRGERSPRSAFRIAWRAGSNTALMCGCVGIGRACDAASRNTESTGSRASSGSAVQASRVATTWRPTRARITAAGTSVRASARAMAAEGSWLREETKAPSTVA